MLWYDPGFPSLVVTYGVANDLFFSGHTAIAIYGACEMARTRRPPLIIVSVLIVLFEVSTVILLRAHYTMDVMAGIFAALLIQMAMTLYWPEEFPTRSREASSL